MDELAIFTRAIDIEHPDERAAFLQQACGEDAALRARIEALLLSHEAAGRFLRGSPLGVSPATIDMPPYERPGTTIGPYKLLKQIGQGGMGTVFLAEQTEPVQRKVALKVIKPGMDTLQVVARFEAERQALAMMDHVNIARVLDAGTTNAGRPYFVMELVHGVPITKYCDDNRLTARQRLELFVPVCQAIQHAHQKGIIHRDIKPSNVMVTLYDGKPVPKVIDFGVAKATEQRLTERTLFTQFGTMVGTLEYMSPEQADMSALGIDTRSDIYSLGVLLYELLTGSTPLSHKRVREAAYAEVLRMIKEEEPPRPSTRLSDSGEALASISAQRHTEPAKLTKLVRGELDWIVMRCLEKDRNRRYETANAFVADVQRYLNDETVQACPPSAGYRLGKVVRRHRGPVLAAALVLLALLAGVVGTTWGLIRAEQARQAEAGQRALAEANEQKALEQKRIAEAVRNFLQRDLLRQADSAEQANAVRQAGNEFETTENPTIKELLDRAAAALTPGKIEARFPQQREVQASILQTVGITYWAIGEDAKAVQFLERSSDTYRHIFGADHHDTLTTLDHLAGAYLSVGNMAEAIALFEQVRNTRVKKLGANHPDTLTTLDYLAMAYASDGKTAEAIALSEQVRDARLKTLGPDHSDTLTTLHNLAQVYLKGGRTTEAIALFEQVRDARVKKFGADYPHNLMTLDRMGGAYLSAGKTAEAIALYEKLRDAWVKKIGADHPQTLATLLNLARAYQVAGRTAEAFVLSEQVRDACVKKLGTDHPITLATFNYLAGAYLLAGKTAEAIALFEQVRDARVKKLGADHPDTLCTFADLAVSYQAARKLELALPLFQQAAVGIEKQQFVHPQAGPIVAALIACHGELNQYDQAEAWQRKWLAVVKERSGADSLPYTIEMALLGRNLLQQMKYSDAESLLRECLNIRQENLPEDWTRFSAESLVGGALLGQKKYADAEPLLLSGYEGMQQREAKIPANGKKNLTDALERVAQLYDAWGTTDQADEWRKKLEAHKKEISEVRNQESEK